MKRKPTNHQKRSGAALAEVTKTAPNSLTFASPNAGCKLRRSELATIAPRLSVVWGDSVVWGESSNSGFSVVWGAGDDSGGGP